MLDNPADGSWRVSQKRHLDNLLSHSRESTRYYQSAVGHLPRYELSIESFPVVNKDILRGNYSEFASNKFDRSSLTVVKTSGSTGTPLEMLQDPNKRKRHRADVIYMASRAGFTLGQKLFSLRLWHSHYFISPSKQFFNNIKPVSVTKLSDTDIANLMGQICRQKSPVGLLGYPSSFEQICRFLDKNEGDIQIPKNIGSVILIGESLHPNTRERFSKYFGVRPVARYSSSECRIISQQCKHESNEYHLNVASYYVEILDDENRPLPDGEAGRIVVTDLFNYGLPLIRYDTGDIGAISNDSNCDWKTPVLSRVEGRKTDMLFDSSGQHVSSLHIFFLMQQFTEVIQYQLIQTTKQDYLMRLQIDGTFDREAQLRANLIEHFGADANIELEYHDEIPLLGSGKRQFVVNEYSPMN